MLKRNIGLFLAFFSILDASAGAVFSAPKEPYPFVIKVIQSLIKEASVTSQRYDESYALALKEYAEDIEHYERAFKREKSAGHHTSLLTLHAACHKHFLRRLLRIIETTQESLISCYNRCIFITSTPPRKEKKALYALLNKIIALGQQHEKISGLLALAPSHNPSVKKTPQKDSYVRRAAFTPEHARLPGACDYFTV